VVLISTPSPTSITRSRDFIGPSSLASSDI
jgi:hypothetical protein